jgi:hypothetical protein
MSKQLGSAQHIVLTGGTILRVLIIVSCTGQDYGVLQPTPENLCKCLPIEPDIADYRHLAKHVPVPDVPDSRGHRRNHSWLGARPSDTAGCATHSSRAAVLPRRAWDHCNGISTRARDHGPSRTRTVSSWSRSSCSSCSLSDCKRPGTTCRSGVLKSLSVVKALIA